MSDDVEQKEFAEHRDAQLQFQADLNIRQFKRENAVLKSKYNEAIARNELLTKEINFVRDVNSACVSDTPIEPKFPKGTGEAVAIISLTDVHLFEVVRPETVNHVNEYRTDIAVRRVSNVLRGSLRWVKIHRSGTKVPTAVFFIGGDNMTGHLHEDLVETNSGSPVEETRQLFSILRSSIQFLLDHGDFEHIVCVCCDGNHSRDTVKKRVATRAHHSYEWLVYNLLADAFSNETKLTFKIADGYHVYIKILNFIFRFHHGDEIIYAESFKIRNLS